jgi:hypothetical protein
MVVPPLSFKNVKWHDILAVVFQTETSTKQYSTYP